MKTRGARVLGVALASALLLMHAAPAHATAIAYSDITAMNLNVAAANGTVTFDPYMVTAYAQAQNSLGELDPQFNSASDPATASAGAAVTWAYATASAGAAQWQAASSVNLPGQTVGAANSVGEGIWFTTFTIGCSLASCDPSTAVTFSVDLSGNLNVSTDPYGLLAQTETAFNLQLNGDTVLFDHRLLSIGPNDAQSQSFGMNLNNFLTPQDLLYDTPYFLLLRVDSESQGINTPEPATATLLVLGLGAALRGRRGRGASKARM